MESPKIVGNRSGRKFRQDSNTYQLFVKLFLELPEESLPFTLKNVGKGKAINMAMGMNRCHVQWAQEQGIPEEFMLRSAKARERECGLWDLEISKNERRTRDKAKSNWIGELLNSVIAEEERVKAEQEALQPLGEEEPKVEVDPTDDILKKNGYY